HAADGMLPGMPNRLAQESSPYLLQHAGNPVDWLPWGDEAFERARADDKPIFLSIGYSTCHWCHVMEHESFEDPAVASVINTSFVPVKVDREERPDVDRVYMAFVQATTGAGGWPMSVWLTPDRRPFYGGTYFPPASRWGRPGFVDLLREIARVWGSEREKIEASATALSQRLQEFASTAAAVDHGTMPPASVVREGANLYRQAFDRQHGGFGSAPKFPRPSELLFLLRAARVLEDDELTSMVADTLGAMASGGMYDHIGGGFHRYSVDAEWRVPHFEKMLYDQAQLLLALTETTQATGEASWLAVAGHTISYLMRDLRHPSGGFFSAEDADSLPSEQADVPGARKTEGAFYLWAADEVERVLESDAPVARQFWGIVNQGNVANDPQGEFGAKNILYVAASAEAIAERRGLSAESVMERVERARQRLFDARSSRPRPHLDDKVLTAWNGLAIAALARYARVAEAVETVPRARVSQALALARDAAVFVRRQLWDESRQVLLRRERDGRAGIDGYAEDYAFLIWGLLELVQATGDADSLRWAMRLQQRQNELFWDEHGGGWFATTGQDPTILVRLKEDYDGAEPAAGSVSVGNLLVLAHLGTGEGLLERAERTLERLGPSAGAFARQMPLMLAQLTAWHHGLNQVVIVGATEDPRTEGLRREVGRRHLPFTVCVPVAPGAGQQALAAVLPWLSPMRMQNDEPTAYVCRDFTCELPVTTPEALRSLLDQHVHRINA
ncbi:MAG: thioredoxin domain-containing protein, partial [Vicinamibacterales bacterium]